MENSHLWETVSALDKTDWRELEKFVRSPAFNQRDHVVRLWLYLSDCLRAGTMPGHEAAFAAAFPQSPFDLARLRNSMTLLLGVVEEYLVLRDYRANPLRQSLLLARNWRTLGLPRQFERQLRQIETLHAKHPHQNTDFYHTRYLAEQEQYFFQSMQNRMAGMNLQAVSDNLDIFFLTQKLRYLCLALAHQAIFPAEYDFGILPEALVLLQQGKYLDIPAVSVYYYCYLALTKPADESHFRQFKTLLLEKGAIFPPDERRDLYLLATNYCTRRINEGARAYTHEALEIYREGLREDVILLNGRMSRFTYRNIVSLAISEKELDWGDRFIHDYRDHLEEKHREATFSFNLARLEYERGRYDRALPLLQNAEYSDLLLNLSAKTLAMKIYCEAGQFDLLYSHLDAMQNFIRRHKELGYHRENYRNTIRFLQKIWKTNPSNKKQRAALAADIRQTKAVAERAWLLGLLT